MVQRVIPFSFLVDWICYVGRRWSSTEDGVTLRYIVVTVGGVPVPTFALLVEHRYSCDPLFLPVYVYAGNCYCVRTPRAYTVTLVGLPVR